MAFAIVGCAQVLGLGDYRDGTAGVGGGTGSSSSASSPQECSSPSDCPTGPFGAPSCDAGVCRFTCDPGRLDCDASVGCEVDATSDQAHCGQCQHACSVACIASACDDPIGITAFYDSTCGLLADGTVWCWGLNTNGELGQPDKSDRNTPVKVSLPKAAVSLAGGGLFLSANAYSSHACAILSDKSLWCWGSNSNGELGLGDVSPHTGPQSTLPMGVAEISVGGASTCATMTNGDLLCWGSNDKGQIGIGGPTGVAIDVPSKVPGQWQHVAVGGVHTCAVDNTQTLRCWGWNAAGQLGTGTPGDLTSPGAQVVTQFGPLSNVTEVKAGKHYTCARNGVGTYCWGENAAGQLGVGTMTPSNVAKPVTLPGAAQLACGDFHAGARTDTPAPGTLLLWGENADGQLGDGTAIPSAAPKPIGVTGGSSLSLAERHSCALTSTGAVCWGYNGFGQLGDGTTAAHSAPQRVKWPHP